MPTSPPIRTPSGRSDPRLSRPGLFAALVLSLTACQSVGPDYEAPEAEAPAGWREVGATSVLSRNAPVADWWHGLGDPTLSHLVEATLGRNLDLRIAATRVLEARALRRVARAGDRPVVDGTASFTRRGESDNTAFGPFTPDSDQYRVGLEASWEIDLFGRVRREVEAAEADLAALEADARHLDVLLAAETATAYVDLRAFQRRLAIARENVELQRRTLDLVRTRFEAGLVGERDVAQAATNLASTESRLPELQAGRRQAENRLTTLLGRHPGDLEEAALADGDLPVPPARIAIGVPRDLLRRRPDIRAAERGLAAEVARIGVAEADLYPRLSLLGDLGLAAQTATGLTKSGSTVFGFGPSLRWNLLDGERTRAEIAAAEARAERARLEWEHTVLRALEEAETARSAFLRERERRDHLATAAREAARAAEFARAQYREGLSDFQAVLDSERTLADLEDERTLSEARVVRDLIALYRSLGGGLAR